MDNSLLTFNKNGSDSRLRPYLTGVTEHDTKTLATITLYTGTYQPLAAKTDIDPLSDENNYMVEGVSIEATPQSDNKPSNTIPQLTEAQKNSYYGIFNNFSLLQVSESKDQITKLHQNFGSSWNLFFFGSTPSIYTFRGIFLDTFEYPYYQEFMTMYDKYLMGRKCVEHGYKMKLAYDGKIVSGYLLNIQTVLSNDTPYSKSFSFTMIITSEEFVRNNAYRQVSGKIIQSDLNYNRLDNRHRIVDQYSALFGEQPPKEA